MSGNFSSPNYPNSYPHYEEHFTITVMEGATITLVFEHMDIETHSTCFNDYVEGNYFFHKRNIKKVYMTAVHDTDGTMKMKYCGMTIPEPFMSSGRNITVVFHSDESRNGTGFRAIWFSSEVTISSPNYPQNYGDNFDMV